MSTFYTKKERDLSVCLSGYMFRHALTSHADIIDSDWEHIFKKYRHKTNKNFTLIYEKIVKNQRLLVFLPVGCYGARTFMGRFSACAMLTHDMIAYI